MGVVGPTQASTPVAARFARGAQLAGAAAAVVGSLTIAGWLFAIPALVRLERGAVSIKLSTGAALVMLGVAVRRVVAGKTPRLVRRLALAAIAIAVLALLEEAIGVDLGIDRIALRRAAEDLAPGPMSPMTALCLLALGGTVLAVHTRAAEWLALLIALAAHIAVLDSLYGDGDLYAIGRYDSIAPQSAVAVYALAAAVAVGVYRPRGIARLLMSASPGGMLVRRLLPAAIVVAPLVSMLRTWGESAGLYSPALGRALLVSANSVIFVSLIWHTAATIIRSHEQRIVAETAVRDGDRLLALTLDSIGDAVIASDETGQVIRMNAVAEELTGWTADEARGRPLSEVFRVRDEATGAPAESPADRVLRDGDATAPTNRTVLVCRDGSTRAIADSAAPIRDASDTTRGVVLVFRDQTGAREAERRLRDSEARKAAILASAMDAIISIDPSSAVLELNPASEAMFGKVRSSALGERFTDWLAPGQARDALIQELATGTPAIGTRIELTALRGGAPFPAEASITRNAGDQPSGYTVFVRDVTEAHRARIEQIRSAERLHVLAHVSEVFAAVSTTYQPLFDRVARTVADLVGDGCVVWLIAPDGDHLYGAATAHRDPGLEQDHRAYISAVAMSRATSHSVSATVARTGKPVRAEVAPADLLARTEPSLQPLVERLGIHGYAIVPIRAGTAVIGVLAVMRNAPGRSYTDDDLTLLSDIADRAGLAIDNAALYARLEQRVHERTAELESANQELEAFSYSVAHDLRAPLRAISGFSHALIEDAADHLSCEDLRHAQRIFQAANRMAELIEDLLDLSRISRTEPRRRQVDITALARSVIAGLRSAEPDRKVESVIADGLFDHADPRLLEVVLTNLIGNAWKFTSKQPDARIELGVVSGERPTVYVVRDNGAGFDPAQADKLFGVFQRLHTDQEFEGTGIGLATVRRVIQRHGGRIWAESQPDAGAAFYFTLHAPQIIARAASPR